MRNQILLPIKRKWFQMLQSGIRLAEYRASSSFWVSRVYGNLELAVFKNGYNSNAPRLELPIAYICRYYSSMQGKLLSLAGNEFPNSEGAYEAYCKPEWGFVPTESQFVFIFANQHGRTLLVDFTGYSNSLPKIDGGG